VSERFSNTLRQISQRPILRAAVILSIVTLLITNHLQITIWKLLDGWSNLKKLGSEAFPPDFTVLTERAGWTHPPCTFESDILCSPAVVGMTQTLEIAFLATVFGMLLSLPLAAMAASNLSPYWLSQSMRQVLAAMRVLPSLIWALIFVIIVGIGPLAGVLAMTMYTVGYLGKMQYEALEGVSKEPLEVARAMGLPRWQVARFFAIPEASNALISQMLFMFEYNVRHGSVIGLVGAGGIGWYMNHYLTPFQLYDKVLALIVVMFVVVVIIDQISLVVRRGFIDDTSNLPRPRWRDVLLMRDPVRSSSSESLD